QSRAPPLYRRRARASQARPRRFRRTDDNSGSKRYNHDGADRHGARHRSRRQRIRRELGETRREHHGIVGAGAGDAQALREAVLAAGTFEMYLRYTDILNATDIDRAFEAAAKGRADALMVL